MSAAPPGGGDALLRRLVRDAALACAALALATLAVVPQRPRIGLGVIGGGVLIGLAFWAIRGAVVQVTAAAETGENRGKTRRFALVKFFTRHAILAVAGYGMMVRLQLHPVGLLIGVSSILVAAAIESLRSGRR
jgi:ATP synthase I chain